MKQTKGQQTSFIVFIGKTRDGLPGIIIGATLCAMIAFSVCAKAAWASETAQEETSATYVSPNRSFSVLMPAGWEKGEQGFLAEKTDSLRFYAPNAFYPDHVYIEIVHDARRHKTAKRFIYDQLKTGMSQGEAEPVDLQSQNVAGRKAQTFTRSISRWSVADPSGKKTEAMEKFVVVPRQEGFCVLTLSAPAASFANYVPVFDNILASFRFHAEEMPSKTDDVTDEEYQVYSDFFHVRKAPDLTSPVSDLFPSQGRLVYELTSTAKKMTAAELKNIQASLGKEGASILGDYRRKNAKAFLLKDKIMADGIEIFTEQDMSEATGENLRGFSEALTKKHPLRGELVRLSRIGFNKARDRAFFHTSIASGFMGAAYYIVMQKTDATWRLQNTFLENYWIY